MKLFKKVLAIALDAAEPYLIEKWINDGTLKNLATLRSKGTYGRLNSSAEWLAGSPWPTFYTGTLPGKHGFYHYLQWKSDKMDYQRPGPEWINAIPFWRQLGDDSKVIAVDVPLTFPPVPFNGIEISGWASHDRIYPTSSFPKEKLDWVIKNFGKPPIDTEVGGLLEIGDVLKIKDELILANQKEVKLITSLIKNEEWDLCICCLTSTHRAGHKFWDITNVKGDFSNEQKVQFKSSLKEVYQSCDDAIGEILYSIDNDTTVLIFSLHGMGTNITLADKMLPKMISNILNGENKINKKENKNFVKKIRDTIPLETRAKLRKLLPFQIQDKMTAYWRMGTIDWNKTKVFNLLADLQGYIRINLKGREKEGIVEDEEYDQLCSQIINGLNTFKDLETSEQVIESVMRKDEIFYKGKGFNNLPDLLVKWKDKPAASYGKIVSSEFGELEWPSPGLNPGGRSGNHRPEGFLLATGENIKNNSDFGKKHIVDLAPTILHLLGVPIPENYDGKVLNDILS
jgi:predicted AlkP superfamily phosphohydrolase/phosphomutase